jgi:hypothetical protein
MLSEFRVDSGEFLGGLLTRSLAALMKEGLITLDEVITDGTKIREPRRAVRRCRDTTGAVFSLGKCFRARTAPVLAPCIAGFLACSLDG